MYFEVGFFLDWERLKINNAELILRYFLKIFSLHIFHVYPKHVNWSDFFF